MIVVGRKLSESRVCFATFLIDRGCRGVKDVIANPNAQLSEYQDLIPGGVAETREIDPSFALKLIEQAWCYGTALGFKPKSGTAFSAALNIFGRTDPSTCSEEFVFGWRGKPLYVPGEDPNPENIISHLTDMLGTDGFVLANSEELPPKLYPLE
jgi:hypothetical protein